MQASAIPQMPQVCEQMPAPMKMQLADGRVVHASDAYGLCSRSTWPFYPPSWVPKLPFDPPDSISIADFIFDENYGRHPLGYSRPMFTCGITGKEYSALEVKERVDYLARGLAKELGWRPNEGTEWHKVIGVFSLNTIDTAPLAWATHRLGGIQTPANAAYSADELEYQLKNSRAQCLFTCVPLLGTAKIAAKKCGIPDNRIYILEVPKELTGGKEAPAGMKTVDDFIREGAKLDRLEPLNLAPGEGAKRTAFLCYSSGTSGLPKGVMISHRNVIANTLQMKVFDGPTRKKMQQPGTQSDYTENALGLLPMSHIYSLVVVCHASAYRGDGVIVLPKFEFAQMLGAIQRFKINALYLVPPIIILMAKDKATREKFDLSSVWSIFTGAAPLGKETADEVQAIYPDWKIRQGYGLTETCTVVCSSSPHDIWFGSSGSLLPDIECKIVTPEGNEITGYDQPGELLVKSPAVVLGYLNNDKANKETFQDGYMRTGDEAVIRKSPSGHEHVFIVDRIKELIKVKGHQVAPAELEGHLLAHPAVNDCAVIQIPDDRSGEVPKAFVVKSPSVSAEESDRILARSIQKHVEDHKARYKWITGGIEFIDVIPKSPSGKILRRLLRDKEKEKRRQTGSKFSCDMAIPDSNAPHHEDEDIHEENEMLDADEADEEILDDGDVPMDSDDEGAGEEIQMTINLQNDSAAHFDKHTDSIFCIAQHPVHANIVATGGGDDVGFVFDTSSAQTAPEPSGQPQEREGLKELFKLDGHKESINAIVFSEPKGQFVATAGLDGKVRAWQGVPDGTKWKFLAEAQEVEEINWLIANPSPNHPNVVALGANDGSVWVYQLATDKGSELQVLQAYYLHTETCTAGAWSPDGNLLATVSEDSSLYVWDVFGEAAAQGLTSATDSQTVVGLTGVDERFRVEGGLYTVAIAPSGTFLTVGGPEGHVRVVGLPRLSVTSEAGTSSGGQGASAKAGGGKQAAAKGGASSAGQTGQILASLQAGTDNVETLSFSSPPLTLMAAGNVDGSITLFDTAHRFAIRRRIEDAHADEDFAHAVVKVEFLRKEGARAWILTSAGYDGVLRRWDARGGTAAAAKGLIGEWKGHRGGGEGGGVMGFVQGGDGSQVITAGDDGVALVFSTPLP
ncbi:acetyl-CoA synthetase-like protein [Karstenula rhodostoma CBS 690.94]|uniref:Acetyl-CoA synthetase-like protein n=1 Tax=Karstenula rhodostoma CBS 690.94 TaxID=1392251 RepID=A0A9P4U8G3_9PLEO|nr:acetyl-CoA synthetase-like protein [Karstenula rhodostoma CBS 690.94]